MGRVAKWKPLRGFSRGLLDQRGEVFAPDALSPLSRERSPWAAPLSPLEEWRALEYRILTPPTDEGWRR